MTWRFRALRVWGLGFGLEGLGFRVSAWAVWFIDGRIARVEWMFRVQLGLPDCVVIVVPAVVFHMILDMRARDGRVC